MLPRLRIPGRASASSWDGCRKNEARRWAAAANIADASERGRSHASHPRAHGPLTIVHRGHSHSSPSCSLGPGGWTRLLLLLLLLLLLRLLRLLLLMVLMVSGWSLGMLRPPLVLGPVLVLGQALRPPTPAAPSSPMPSAPSEGEASSGGGEATLLLSPPPFAPLPPAADGHKTKELAGGMESGGGRAMPLEAGLVLVLVLLVAKGLLDSGGAKR